MLSSGTATWHPDVRHVRVDGALLRVAVVGDGPVLLLLNGIGANIEMWQAFAQSLPGRTLVMFDFPGTGASPALPVPLRMPAIAALVVRLMDQLGHDRVDVLGYSWGGALAQELAHRAPGRVRSLILAATIPGLGGRPPSPWVVAAMSTPLRYWSHGYLRLIAPVVYGTSVGPDEEHARARQALPPTVRGYMHQLYAISGWTSRRWLGRLRVPTLVLSGRGDRLAPAANGRILARSIRDARLVELPGGHLFLLQEAALAAAAVESFLTVVSPG